MHTIPYDTMRDSLYHPGNAKDFFQYGPAQTQTEAALCAEMARLSYVEDESDLKGYLGRADFKLVGDPIGYGSGGTQLFVARGNKQVGGCTVIVVSFRGTEPDDPSDLVSDLKFIRKPWKNKSGEGIGLVHGGFSDALLTEPKGASTGEKAASVLDQIVRMLSQLASSDADPIRLLLTGHSLGAALATLTASYLAGDPLAANLHLYTFGSPRVGDVSFATAMTMIDHSRYVNCSDLVTRVPPEELGFVHIGSLRYIDREGHLSKTISETQIRDDRSQATAHYLMRYAWLPKTVWVREMADHSPINYVSGVAGLRP